MTEETLEPRIIAELKGKENNPTLTVCMGYAIPDVGKVPCSTIKRRGEWFPLVEVDYRYILDYANAAEYKISHGFCPDCYKKQMEYNGIGDEDGNI